MKRRIVEEPARLMLIIAGALTASSVQARMPAEPVAPAGGPVSSSANAAAVADASQRQEQHQGQLQLSTSEATGGDATATGGEAQALGIGQGGAGGDASSRQDVSIRYRDRLQAPALMAPAVYASGPCAYGWSVGVSVPGAGVTGGKSRTDPGCDRRELARVLTPLQPALALKLLCADPMLAEVALPEDCVYFTPPVVIATPAPAPLDPRYATPGDVSEKVNRAFEASQAKGAQ